MTQHTISFITAISYTLSDLLPKLGFLKAAKAIHEIFLAHIMRLPMTFFFTNLTGRLLSRFSKDIDVIDQNLPRQLDSFVFFAIQVMRRFRSFGEGQKKIFF
jgi:ATP-binding cassette, subfamily C (CFTR/MRP), member 1